MAYLVLKKGYQRRKGFLALRRVEYMGLGRWLRRRLSTERYIKADFLMIVGGIGAGKSRELKKLQKWAGELWDTEGVYFSAIESLENFFKRAGLEKEQLRGLSQAEKIELLIEACKGKAVFIDDVDKAEGRLKRQVIKRLIRVSKGGAVSCENEKIDQSILQEIRRKQKLRKFEAVRIVDIGRSEEVKDIGMIVAVILIGVALFYGFHEALLGALGVRYLLRSEK